MNRSNKKRKKMKDRKLREEETMTPEQREARRIDEEKQTREREEDEELEREQQEEEEKIKKYSELAKKINYDPLPDWTNKSKYWCGQETWERVGGMSEEEKVEHRGIEIHTDEGVIENINSEEDLIKRCSCCGLCFGQLLLLSLEW